MGPMSPGCKSHDTRPSARAVLYVCGAYKVRPPNVYRVSVGRSLTVDTPTFLELAIPLHIYPYSVLKGV